MKKTVNCFVLAVLIVIIPHSIHAQRKQSSLPHILGWDLTYSSVLKRKKVGKKEWIRKWLGRNYQSPVKELLGDWKEEPIVSSILVEYPAHHGEHVTLWLVRTKGQAYQWKFFDGKPFIHIKEPLSVELYDKMAGTISSWQQSEPLKPEETPNRLTGGYFGLLSFYGGGESWQMLLTLKDFILFDNKDTKEGKPGRLPQVLEPILQKE